MEKLFDKNDVLTGLEAEQAALGTPGYFGDTLSNLVTAITKHEIKTLTGIDQNKAYCFWTNDNHQYILFLPADKVKKKEPVYRPIKTIDELFNFLVPSFTADYNTFDKADIIFTFVFELKGKNSGYIHYKKFTSIRVTDDGIVLDAFTLDYYFENYEIKVNGEFVPFGVKE